MNINGKHIERLVRRALIASLRLLPRRNRGPRDLASLRSPRILLLRHDRIGDAIVSTPIVALLRERFAGARIDMLLGMKNQVAAPLLIGIDTVMVVPTDLAGMARCISAMRRNRYDVVINLLAKDSVSGAILTALSGATSAIGFEGSANGVYDIVIPKPSAPMHIVPETSLLLAPLGIRPIGEKPVRPPERLRVALPGGSEKMTAGFIGARRTAPVVVINITGAPEKYWGRDNFIRLTRELMNDGFHTVLAAAPRDTAELEALSKETGAQTLPIRRALEDFVAFLDLADIIVTPDTSIVHISAALGKPTVMLAPDAEVGNIWRPWGVQGRVVAGNGSVAAILVASVRESVRSLAAQSAAELHTS